MKYQDFKEITSPNNCYCFVCGDRIGAGSKRMVTSQGLPLCLLCFKAWLIEKVELYKISRSKIKDGFMIENH